MSKTIEDEWKLAPIKPTLEMAEKGAEAFSLPHPQSVGAENERAAIIYRLMLDAAPEGRPSESVRGEEAHADDLAVDRFAAAMKAKLAEKRAQGYGGWDNPDDCTVEWLSELLRKHVDKGDPVDVGNFAMMIQQRGERIK